MVLSQIAKGTTEFIIWNWQISFHDYSHSCRSLYPGVSVENMRDYGNKRYRIGILGKQGR